VAEVPKTVWASRKKLDPAGICGKTVLHGSMMQWANGGLAGSLAVVVGGSEGASRTVKKMDGNMRSRPGRVLRAADIIPPFCNDVLPSEADNGVNPPANEAAKVNEPESEQKLSRIQGAQGGDGGAEVPTYDLAENILAAHRQSAARRRRSPGRAQPQPQPVPAPASIRLQIAEPPTQDPLDIRRMVAEIVARDIERLCRKPSKPLYAL
jgi:hypothetical protein